LEAIAANATLVARSFAGDPKQVRELLKIAFSHSGIAVLDIISPCVTFNNHDESTKSYTYGKQHQESLQDITYVPAYEEITVDYPEGEKQIVTLHDGSNNLLRKLDPKHHDPTNKVNAYHLLEEARMNQEFITGLIYVEPESTALAEANNMVDTPLVHLSDEVTRPSRAALDDVMGKIKN